MSFNYSIKLNGKDLENNDEEILVCFLQMLDFSADHLHSVYSTETIRFCVKDQVIIVEDKKKHKIEVDKLANELGFQIKNK